MKKALILIALLFVPALVFAQDTTPQDLSMWEQLIPLAITVVVPLLIQLGKRFIPAIPKWVLPVLAPALGVALSFVLDLGAGENVGVILGAVYGGLGTWLREMMKQINAVLAESKTEGVG